MYKRQGFLDEEYRFGWCENVLWVGEYDWLYRCHFRCEDEAAGAGLWFEGLDTYAEDVYKRQVGYTMKAWNPKSIFIVSREALTAKRDGTSIWPT